MNLGTPWMRRNRGNIPPQTPVGKAVAKAVIPGWEKQGAQTKRVKQASPKRPEFNEKAIQAAKARMRKEKEFMKKNADQYGILRKGSK